LSLFIAIAVTVLSRAQISLRSITRIISTPGLLPFTSHFSSLSSTISTGELFTQRLVLLSVIETLQIAFIVFFRSTLHSLSPFTRTRS